VEGLQERSYVLRFSLSEDKSSYGVLYTLKGVD